MEHFKTKNVYMIGAEEFSQEADLDSPRETQGNYISSVGASQISTIPADLVEQISKMHCVTGVYVPSYPFEEVFRGPSFTYPEKGLENLLPKAFIPIQTWEFLNALCLRNHILFYERPFKAE